MSRQAVEDIYPLSPTQQGMLFHSLYSPQSGVYVVQVGYTVHGELERQVLARAWQYLVQRHAVLRSAFVWHNLEAPLQVVGRQVSLPLTYEDWRQRAPTPQAVSAWMAQDRLQGFDLSTAPLMRCTILHLSDDVYRLIWTYHHILLDGWSVSVLLQELLLCYQACSRGQMPSLPTRRPYRDYIAWLQQQDLQAAQQFWRQRLQGLTGPTPLRIERPGSPRDLASQPQHAAAQHQVSPQLTQRLRQLAQSQRLTLNTLIQGAWALLLSRYSAESEVLFGATCAGRPTALSGTDQMVGLFINTLPVRLDVSPEPALLPWLQQLQTQQLAQQPYEYTPLVHVHGCSDISRALPLFDSLVVFENYPVAPALRQGAQALRIDEVVTAEQTHYPLTLFASVDHTLALKVLYDSARFSAAAMQRLLGHLETVLHGMVTTPEGTLGNLSLLSEPEYHHLLSAWNPAATGIDTDCVHDCIALQADRTPEATAVVCATQRLSYRELNEGANQLAAYLRQQGVQPGDRVGLCISRSPAMLVGLLGILKAGGAYVPLDASYPGERLAFTIADASIQTLLTASEAGTPALALPTLETLRRVDLVTDWPMIAPHSTDNPVTPGRLDDMAYAIYTSGSTGQPKGVPIQHRSLINLLHATAERLAITASDRLLAVTTIAFDIAALELFLPLIVGGQVVLATLPMVADGQQLQAQLAMHQVTVMQATPATWRLLLDSGWQGQKGLTMLCGGEALDVSLARQLLTCGAALWNMYGPTETTIWSSALHLTPELLIEDTTPIGHPLANMQFYVLDAQQQPVPIGVPGDLYIGGAGLSPGYLNRDDLTSAAFIPNPLPAPYAAVSPRLYKTGDRVRYREDGRLEYLGRLDAQIKLRGFRIELGEIETVLAQHPDVAQAVVVVRADEPQNPQLVAYLRLSAGLDPSGLHTILRQYLSQKLPAYMLPAAYVVLDALPLTANGKVNRQALPAPSGQRPRLGVPFACPQTAAETTIAAIWQAALGLEHVGLHDNFFDLGGHSLRMVKVHSQLQQQLALDMPLVELFRYPTVSALAAYVSQRQTEGDARPDTRSAALEAGKQRRQQRLQQRVGTRQQVGGQQHD